MTACGGMQRHLFEADSDVCIFCLALDPSTYWCTEPPEGHYLAGPGPCGHPGCEIDMTETWNRVTDMLSGADDD